MNRFLAFLRALLFLAAALPIGAATLALLIAGWTATAVLSVTPLVVPVLMGFRRATGLLAAADAAIARSLLGVDVRPSSASAATGYWRRGWAVIADGGFWREQVYLVLRMTLGFGLAVGEVALLAASLGSLAFPAWYRWGPDLRFRSWHVDTLPRSLVLVPIGLVGLAAAIVLAQLFAAMFGRLARGLLGSGERPGGPLSRTARRRALATHAAASAGVGLVLVLVWALTGRGYVWPEWALLPLALVLSIHGWVELVDERAALRRARGLAIHAGIDAALFAFLVLTWALTTRGYFWPVWPALGFAIALGIHWGAARSSRLSRRVGVLEHTRAGAVDAQETELRRIERDLHDGAQARLVALGMSLGLAEQKLASDPASAQQLVAEARLGVGEALRELRDLARGIHPPVLSDRGLAAALETLADHSAIPVSVSVHLDERLPDAIETAAYFVAAEALANAAKHSGASRIEIDVRCEAQRLAIAVRDDGTGGADAGGSGLTGLRRRVEALDGALLVSSPEGGPTTVQAELPCAS
ncbi:MAG: sensor domain-containing protein [Gaiellaceae bacterium]